MPLSKRQLCQRLQAGMQVLKDYSCCFFLMISVSEKAALTRPQEFL
jgi:hypothetical protein